MIKLNKLNKYYNKGKSNEIHVINNTSIVFPEKGLVALTGPSGCGKTTLLNVIGGLDKFDSGEINFNGDIIKKYHPLNIDIIRNQYIGYIFQNYNLISDKTVYENIEIALNMAGLYDKSEIEERINYVLNAVGMYNYRRRSVLALSGGQQQRIAIARAIAKNPKVVLADEPTGNLDANNTFEVMSIIKKISQSCLVILVSHERSLVDFYADKVIELSDGKVINRYSNSGDKSFDHVDERNIYLKDLQKDNLLEDHNIIRYYEKAKDDSLTFKIIEIKDSIYIKAETSSKKKIKYLTSDTEIKLIDDHYKAKKTNDALERTFDLDHYGDIKHSNKKKSFIRLRDTMKSGLAKVTSRRKFIGWLFLIAYFVISALVVYQLATFATLTQVDEKEFLHTGKNLISLKVEQDVNSSDINLILNSVDNVEWSPYYSSVSAMIRYNEYYQGTASASVEIYPIKKSWINDNDIVYGRNIENNLEIVLDMWVINDILDNKQFADLGLTNPEDLIGSYISSTNGTNANFKIVGIINTNSPIAIISDDAIYSFVNLYGYISFGAAKDRIEILEGSEIQNNNEVLVTSDMDLAVGDDYIFDEKTFKVVGIYRSADNLPNQSNKFPEYYEQQQNVVFSNSVVADKVKEQVNSMMHYGNNSIYFYSDDIDKAVKDINDLNPNYEAFNSYEAQRNYQINAQRSAVAHRVQSIIITLVGIIIYIFFMMRSSMISRIKEIGIYRSIGATKRDIYKIFIGEIFWFTTLGSLTGYLSMSLLINRIQNMIGDLVSVFYFPLYFFLGGIIGIYLINLVFGLLPIFNLLRKTPSEIIAKFDI